MAILKTYHISQKFLSKMLGWGEITLTRYINGNYTPNISNSARLKELKNPYVFQMTLQRYRTNQVEGDEEKVIKKVQDRVYCELAKMEKSSGKIYDVVNWFLSQSSEEEPLTHLALQKLLYFTQGWSKVLLGREMFDEDCQAWVHGAVYPKVYEYFKQFKYNPLPKVEIKDQLEEEELKVLKAIKKFYFDVYSAKALEEICHREEPYIKARKGYRNEEICHKVINKKDISLYYNQISEKYNITLVNISNIRVYLNAILS